MTKKYHQLQNPETGSFCAEIVSTETHNKCHVSQENLWNDIKWESAAVSALTALFFYNLVNKKIKTDKLNNGIGATGAVIGIFLSDIAYKVHTKTEKVENITLPMLEVMEYNRFAQESENNWRSISHSRELQNNTVSTFLNLESHCKNAYNTDIVSPAPVSAILAHGEDCAPNIVGGTSYTSDSTDISIIYNGS